MAITIDWTNKIIQIPRADLTLIQSVPSEIRQLDLDAFRLELKALEADEGMPFEDTHLHNTTVTVGGVSLARVIEIINGYTVTFEDGQYAVNLIGANSNVGDVVNVNQVSVRSANSAGLTDVGLQRRLDYQGVVVVSNDSAATAGIQHPIGTSILPVNNINDALIILANNGLSTVKFETDFIIDSSHDIRGLTIEGGLNNSNIEGDDFILRSKITLDSNVNTNGVFFTQLEVQGSMKGRAVLERCIVNEIKGFSANAFNCGFRGPINVDSNSLELLIINGYSSIAGDSAPIWNFINSSSNAAFRRWCGGLQLENCSDSDIKITAEFDAGKLRITPSNTDGFISARGLVKIYDSSGPGCIIDATASIGELASGIDVTAIETKLDTLISDALTKREFLALS